MNFSERRAAATSNEVILFKTKLRNDHQRFAQNGEGQCVPTYLSHFFRINYKNLGLTPNLVARELGTTISDGTPNGSLERFLKNSRTAHFIGSEWPIGKFNNLINKLPPGAMVLTTFFDTRSRPNHSPKSDKWEEHLLWNQGSFYKNNRFSVRVWDSDSLIGGFKKIPLADYQAFWHDGLLSKLHGHIIETSESIGWFVVLGVNKEWVRQTVGNPENFMLGRQKNTRTRITDLGRLVVDPDGVEPSTSTL